MNSDRISSGQLHCHLWRCIVTYNPKVTKQRRKDLETNKDKKEIKQSDVAKAIFVIYIWLEHYGCAHSAVSAAEEA